MVFVSGVPQLAASPKMNSPPYRGGRPMAWVPGVGPAGGERGRTASGPDPEQAGQPAGTPVRDRRGRVGDDREMSGSPGCHCLAVTRRCTTSRSCAAVHRQHDAPVRSPRYRRRSESGPEPVDVDPPAVQRAVTPAVFTGQGHPGGQRLHCDQRGTRLASAVDTCSGEALGIGDRRVGVGAVEQDRNHCSRYRRSMSCLAPVCSSRGHGTGRLPAIEPQDTASTKFTLTLTPFA